MGDSGERGAALAQTRLHQFSANSENTDKIEGGGPAAYKGGIPAARPGRCPHVPALSPSAPHSQPKPLPLLGTSPLPDPRALTLPAVLPTCLETPSCCSNRATFLLCHLQPCQGMLKEGAIKSLGATGPRHHCHIVRFLPQGMGLYPMGVVSGLGVEGDWAG